MSTLSKDVGRCWCGGGLVEKDVDDDMVTMVCAESDLHNPYATGRPVEIRRLYVAGPCSGYPENNYPEFNRVADELELAGYDVVNPATVHISGRYHYVDLLREDLRAMLECDGVAVLENWWESVGARNEVMVAGLLKMPVRTFQEWLYIREKLG